MKRPSSYPVTIVAILALCFATAFAVGLLSLPTGPVSVTHGEWNAGASSTLDITLSDVPDGFDVMNGTYVGWCLEDNHRDDVPDGTSVTLLDSTDPEPLNCEGYNAIPWDEINYLLNHKQGTVQDQQAALWIVAGTDDLASPTFPTTDVVNAMVAMAQSNGSGFIPGPGDVIAVILCADGIGLDGFQDTLIEVPLPGCGDETVTPPETCDPPGDIPNPTYPDNACRDNCTYCGDGNQDPGETCDPPGGIPNASYPNNACRDNCTYCGDGMVNNGEECDPAIDQNCNPDCTRRELGITRTIGYWKTHPTVINGTFDGPGGFLSLLPVNFCGEPIAEACDAVAFLSTGGGGVDCFKRQGMGALLNCQAFGCSGDIADLLQAGSDACDNGNDFDFGGACEDLDAFNNSGDNMDLPFQSPSALPHLCDDQVNDAASTKKKK